MKKIAIAVTLAAGLGLGSLAGVQAALPKPPAKSDAEKAAEAEKAAAAKAKEADLNNKAMDKAVAKQLLAQAGFPQARFLAFREDEVGPGTAGRCAAELHGVEELHLDPAARLGFHFLRPGNERAGRYGGLRRQHLVQAQGHHLLGRGLPGQACQGDSAKGQQGGAAF